MATITIQLDAAVEAQLEDLAHQQDRSPAEVAAELIQVHLQQLAQSHEQILEGIAEFDQGFAGIPHEKVDAWLASWGTESELPPPQ